MNPKYIFASLNRVTRSGAKRRGYIALLLLSGALAAAEEATVRLRGSLSPSIARAHRMGALLDQGQEIEFAITFPVRQPAQLDALLKSLYTPGDPLYRCYLKTGEFTERFGPTQADYDAVIAFVKQQGLRVKHTQPSRAQLNVAGSVEIVERTFGVQLLRFQAEDGRVFRAPDTDPRLPISIARRVAGVIGLDDSARRQSFALTETGPRGMTPSGIKKAYNLEGLTLTGAGQTLAIAALDDFADADITAYADHFGLPHVPLQRIPVNGGATSARLEATMDIELAMALAPGLDRILVYETAATVPDSLAMLERIAIDNLAQQVSISWGEAETAVPPAVRDRENTAFMRMACQGQSAYAAAGDLGTGSGVNDPASQPYVVGVGGTQLILDADGTYLYEVVWEFGPPPYGGGGGTSRVWTLPDYQVGAVSPESKGSTTHRNVPDVSLNADPGTGYAAYFRGAWQPPVGGTSAGAPLWAAFNALINEQRALNGVGSLGFPNPTFYNLFHTPRYPEDFHDVKDTLARGSFPAVPGYDNVTGLGTFNGRNLLNDVQMDRIILHVDAAFTGSPQIGTFNNPFKTLTAAVTAAPGNWPGFIYIKGNTYPENNLTIRKNVTLINNGGGPVTIGH